MSYSAGDLEVVLNGIDDNASKSISTVIRRLNSLQKSLSAITKLNVSKPLSKISAIFSTISTAVNNIDATKVSSIATISRSINTLSKSLTTLNDTQTVLAGTKIEVLFSKIANATNSVNATNLANLASAAKSLSSLTKLQKLEKLDWNKIGKGFESLTTSITPFLNKLQQAETSLTSLYGILSKTTGKQLQGFTTSNTSKSKDTLFSLAKFSAVYIATRRIGSALAKVVQYGTDYTETLNLWQVAMRDNVAQAEEFVNKMNKAYGISVQTLMNAQAIFKNMLSGLGEISDTTAYTISEAITQMALDYASLYNIKLEDAFTKFQAALAGQVRPIRSVSGYDITENTLEQVYKALGGTKSVRNLTQTEKRLLSIYAIFKQMSESGALGDMTKTLDNFANQTRMATENWKTLMTWTGISLQYLLQELGVMKYINAALITASKIMEAIAYSLGYVDPDFGLSWEENIDGASDAVDELQGKLLDFDKFRSLSGTEENILGIDETLLNAISGYSSFIDKAKNDAQKLANEWLKILGFTEGADGNLVITDENLKKIKNTIIAIGAGIGVIASFAIVSGLVKIITTIFTLKNALILLQAALVTGIVYAIVQAVQAFKDGDIGAGLLATTIAVALVGAWVLLNAQMLKSIGLKIGSFFSNIASILTQKTTPALLNATKQMSAFNYAMAAIGITILAIGLNEFISNLDNMTTTAKILIPVIATLAAVLTGLAVAYAAAQAGIAAPAIAGLTAAAIAAGIVLAAGTAIAVKNYAKGGMVDVDKGTLFRAGEAGAEVVYNNSDGSTGVATVNQLKSAVYQGAYQALVEWSKSSTDGNINLTVNLDGEKIYQNTTAHAKRRGEYWSKTR